MENKEQHVDWAGLVYYDAKIKEYINSSTASKEEQVQLRSDLEQLEQLLTTLTMSFATDKEHIYKHINECMNGSATKEELQAALDAIREEIKTLTGVDLSDYATKDFVEQKLDDLQLSVELPDDLVTTEDIKDFVTREDVAEEIGKIVPPEVDLTSLATKEQLSAVEATIPSVEGLASETYVDEKVASVVIPEVPTRVSELENDAGYVTEDSVSQYAKHFVLEVTPGYPYSYTNDLSEYLEFDGSKSLSVRIGNEVCSANILDNGYINNDAYNVYFHRGSGERFCASFTLNDNSGMPGYKWKYELTTLSGFATEQDIQESIDALNIPEIPTNISTFTNDAGYLTDVPEEYVTDTELDAKGYLTEHQSLEGLATEQFVADEIAKIDCVSSTTVENIIEEKIEEVVTGGATVSSISYGTF